MEVVVDMTDVVEKLEPEAATEAGVEAGAEAAKVALCGQGCREPEAEKKNTRKRSWKFGLMQPKNAARGLIEAT